MKNGNIRTTGDLRRKLLDLMNAVEHGKIDPGQAKVMTSIAAQINNSFYAEAKVALAMWQMQLPTLNVGDLPMELPRPSARLGHR